MTLKEKRILFSRLFAEHCVWLTSMGQTYAIDEVTERITTKDPNSDHMKNSLHHLGLAGDLIFYDEDGSYLTQTEAHEYSGQVWEKRHELCRWGGRFGDGNHYSLEHEGVK